jgi:hypothetical protein
MANVKISELPAATTPLTGAELVPIVQSGVTDQVTVANLTAGRTVAAATVNVDANSATTALRITQTGAGNALVVEDSTNPDATPFVVDASGKVVIGRTTAPFGSTSLAIEQSVADTAPSNIDFLKNRAGAIVNSGDGLGRIRFWGYDGAAPIAAAEIVAAVDGTPGTNDMPGRLVFSTTADGASTATERMRITSAGNIVAGRSVALATTATDGFLYVPTCAGTPTGTPTSITGMAPIVVNTTNNKLYFYSGGAWRDAGP